MNVYIEPLIDELLKLWNDITMYEGESMDLGNTFWQADLGKTKKTYLDRGFIKPSTEVLIPQPRVNKALDRGFLQPSVEVFINPRSRY